MALEPIKLRRSEPVMTGGVFTLRVYEYLDKLWDYLSNLNSTVSSLSTTVTTGVLPVPVEVNYAASPYTVINKITHIRVDATSGNVQINLMTVDDDVQTVVVKSDSSANTVTVYSADGILGATTAVITTQYECLNIFGMSNEYYLK